MSSKTKVEEEKSIGEQRTRLQFTEKEWRWRTIKTWNGLPESTRD